MMCGYNVLHNQIIFSLLVALPALSRKKFFFRTHIEEKWSSNVAEKIFQNIIIFFLLILKSQCGWQNNLLNFFSSSSHFEVKMWLGEYFFKFVFFFISFWSHNVAGRKIRTNFPGKKLRLTEGLLKKKKIKSKC